MSILFGLCGSYLCKKYFSKNWFTIFIIIKRQMPFYPIPLTYFVGNYASQLRGIKKIILPILGVISGICFILDFLTLPIRWIYHKIIVKDL